MSDTDFIQIQWNSGSIDEARRVSRYLVQEHYVACVNIIPWVESIFMWDKQLDTSQESKVLFKTRLKNFEAIKEIITKNTSYDLPEILYTKIDGGSADYLAWLDENILNVAAVNS